MEAAVTEIAADIFRISTLHPGYGIQFNQFLVRDEEPLLVHTGFRRMFGTTLELPRRRPARNPGAGWHHPRAAGRRRRLTHPRSVRPRFSATTT